MKQNMKIRIEVKDDNHMAAYHCCNRYYHPQIHYKLFKLLNNSFSNQIRNHIFSELKNVQREEIDYGQII